MSIYLSPGHLPMSSLTLDKQSLQSLKKTIMRAMDEGLEEPNKPLRMLHSYIDHFPTGEEKGDFISIDFGGTNMRVVHVSLKGNRKMGFDREKWPIPGDMKKSASGDKLFDWIADKVIQVASKKSGVSFNNYIGFCFSFPLHQNALDSAILLQWNKGFDVSECIGKDIAVMLNDAFSRTNSPFRVGAIANDTVTVLLARTYESPQCMIGSVLGTGFNAAYWQSWSGVPKLKPDLYAAKMGTIINTEVGGFPLPLSHEMDIELDSKSENPGKQHLEKRVSGMYLGRMFQIACRMSDIALSDFSTKRMSEIEEKQGMGWEMAKEISQRSVQYVACSLAAIHDRLGGRPMEAGMEGTVIERYCNYRDRLQKVLEDDFGITNMSIVIVDEYSAIGAAVAACIGKSNMPK